MANPPSSLQDKVILVTGAAKRIGRGIALRLAREGARVAIHYGNSEAEARQTAEECGGAPVVRANLEIVAEIERMFGEVEHSMGRLDGLVNNAARFTRFDPLEITEADWDFIHSVNLKAVFFCCQGGARLMRKTGGGRIVNISSLGGLRPWADHAHYCASKAGVIMLTRALAKAFAPEITVNSVAPGVIPFGNLDGEAMGMIKATPAARGGTADEVAEAVVYFLGASNFITGQIWRWMGGSASDRGSPREATAHRSKPRFQSAYSSSKLRDPLVALTLPWMMERGLGDVIAEQEFDFPGNAGTAEVWLFSLRTREPAIYGVRRNLQELLRGL